MKKKELAQMRQKSKSEVGDLIAQKRKEVSQAYGKIKTGKEKNLKKVKNIKHDIVQLLGIVSGKKEDK